MTIFLKPKSFLGGETLCATIGTIQGKLNGTVIPGMVFLNGFPIKSLIMVQIQWIDMFDFSDFPASLKLPISICAWGGIVSGSSSFLSTFSWSHLLLQFLLHLFKIYIIYTDSHDTYSGSGTQVWITTTDEAENLIKWLLLFSPVNDLLYFLYSLSGTLNTHLSQVLSQYSRTPCLVVLSVLSNLDDRPPKTMNLIICLLCF